MTCMSMPNASRSLIRASMSVSPWLPTLKILSRANFISSGVPLKVVPEPHNLG